MSHRYLDWNVSIQSLIPKVHLHVRLRSAFFHFERYSWLRRLTIGFSRVKVGSNNGKTHFVIGRVNEPWKCQHSISHSKGSITRTIKECVFAFRGIKLTPKAHYWVFTSKGRLKQWENALCNRTCKWTLEMSAFNLSFKRLNYMYD